MLQKVVAKLAEEEFAASSNQRWDSVQMILCQDTKG